MQAGFALYGEVTESYAPCQSWERGNLGAGNTLVQKLMRASSMKQKNGGPLSAIHSMINGPS
jgi:hypothetical protein